MRSDEELEPEVTRWTPKRCFWVLGLVTVVGVASPASKVLTILLPLLSFVFALHLSSKFPRYYVSIVCWLFFLTPMVRRLIEWRSGSSSASVVMIAPYIACVAGLWPLRHRWRDLTTERLQQWHYVSAAIAYGIVAGFFLNSKSSLSVDAAAWIAPLCFAMYVYAERENADELLTGFRDSFTYGVAFMSLYGMYQFFFLAPWDAYWMENSTLTSIGLPEPRQVRLYGTMNTPQPLANCLVAGILFSFSSKSWVRFVNLSVGVLALGLTMSRSGWIGGFVGICALSISFTARQRLWLLNGLIACACFLALMMQIPEINQTMSERLQSFTDLKGDGSANARLASQTYAIELFKNSPFGIGLGSAGADSGGASYGVAHGPEIPLADNGIEEIMLAFGWCGSLIFAFGFVAAVRRSYTGPKIPELLVPRAMLAAVIVQVATNGIFPGPTGFIMWSLIGFCESYRFLSAKDGTKSTSAMVAPAQAASYGVPA